MTVPTPNITFTITPPGGSTTDYTTNLAWAGPSAPSITQHFGRQGDTATFVLSDEYVTTPSFHIPVMSVVKMVDHNAGNAVLFEGLVTDPQINVISSNLTEWTLNCVDFSFYADAGVCHGVFYGFTVDQIVIALTKQANCGIIAKSTAQGGFVAPAPMLASFSMNYASLTTAWKKLAVLAGTVAPYGWYVDGNRNLHFYDQTTAQSSGVTFTSRPTTEGSTTEGHYDTGFTYEWDGTAIRNRILVQGATVVVYYHTTKNPPTDQFRGDGVRDSWSLRYSVIGTPIVTVNGIKQAVTAVPAGSAAGTTNWQVVQNNIGHWSLITTGLDPSPGAVIKIWYNYEVPIVAQANDFASQATYNGPNGGVFATHILDRSITTMPMALNRALRERQEYAFAVERFTFDTSEDWVGWVFAGQTIQVVNDFVPDAQNSYTLGINANFLVISNNVSFGDGGYRVCSITAVRV